MDNSFDNAATGLAGFACVWVVVGAIVALYPLIALGRIWFYSKQSAALLTEIRELLRQR